VCVCRKQLFLRSIAVSWLARLQVVVMQCGGNMHMLCCCMSTVLTTGTATVAARQRPQSLATGLCA
jgi:hypothetical protein